ncbi:hypothetical protein [Lysinibacillus sp. NPDC086135]|uniref:hypothetical protein n=1 Tax=Lysinibacillus sp. NPDC086135 TaxID=3364130 RepID=UPI0038035FCC
MINGVLPIDSKYLLNLIAPLKAIILFTIIYRTVVPIKNTEIKMDDMFINAFKMLVYGALAIYIYVKVRDTGITEIDVLTLFTFILAALEATHNFMNTLGTYIGAALRQGWDYVFASKKY